MEWIAGLDVSLHLKSWFKISMTSDVTHLNITLIFTHFFFPIFVLLPCLISVFFSSSTHRFYCNVGHQFPSSISSIPSSAFFNKLQITFLIHKRKVKRE